MMNPLHEKKVRQALAKAIAKETVKCTVKIAGFPNHTDKEQFEKLVQLEVERVLCPASPTPDITLIPYAFHAPSQEGSVHFKVSGMEKTFRESLDGKEISSSIRENLSVSVEFIRRLGSREDRR